MGSKYRTSKKIIYSPLKLSLFLLFSILVIEIIIMFLLGLLPELSLSTIALLDAFLLIIVLVPLIYYFALSPMFKYSDELKRSEETHRDAREFSENLVRTANVVVVGLNNSGEVNLMNKAAEKVTGYSFEELKGKNWFDILTPKDKYPQVWEVFLSLTKTGSTPRTFENPILTKSGEERFISWQNSLVFEGEIKTGTISFGIDFTERKKAELVEKVRYEITHGVTTTSNLDELLLLIHLSLKKVIYAENCFFALYDEVTGYISFPLFVDKFDSKPQPLPLPKSCTGYVYRSGKSIIFTPDLFNQLISQNEIELIGSPFRSWIGVPLKTSDRTIGVLVLQHYEKENVYNESDLIFLDLIASQVANVIERKRAEEELKISFSLLTATLESTADGILVVDRTGKTTNFNKKFVELWQIPDSVVSTRDDQTLLSFVLTQLKDPEKFIKKVRDLYQSCEESSFDIIEFKDGRIFQRFSKPQIFEEKCVGRVWSFHDITELKKAEKELKESEQKFRAFFEKSPIGIEIYDSAGFQTDANPAALEMFGIEEKNNFSGFNIFDGTSLTPESKNKLQKGEPLEYTATFSFDKVRALNQYKTIKFGTSDFHYLITPLKENNSNSIHGYLLLVQDITTRVQNEKSIKENEARLLELNATKDKFFSIISHDLRSPFSGIMGFSDLLVSKVNETDFDGIAEYARIIQKSSHRAMDLLTNLLDWSRTQTGRMEFNPEYTETVTLIKEVTELFDDTAKHKTITVCKELPHSLPYFLDREMFSTIIRNLLSNAIKFTNRGGKVTLTARGKENELHISVADNGIGMDNDILGKLFQLDKNHTTSGTHDEPGTGLGLILCSEFVKKHNGQIWVESEIGSGSIFHFVLRSQPFSDFN